MSRSIAMLRHDAQIVDFIWIDPAAIGLSTGAAANLKNLLADAQFNYVLLRAESNFAEVLADQDPGRVQLIKIGGAGRLLVREFWVLRLALRTKLRGGDIFYTSWLPRLCFSALLLPIKCRLFVHDLNIFRARIHGRRFQQPSWLSRFHQYLSIKRATIVQCFARSVARQLKLLRRDTIAIVGQTVRIVPPARSEKRGRSAVIFLDNRDYKGTWALDRLYSSKIGFQLTVIGKIDETHEKRLTSRGLAVRSLRPSDKDKFLLITEADFVIFASKFEGFGLPPREAAAVGTPSLIARRAALLDIPAPLSLSIERCGSRIDLDAIAELAAQIDRGALKQWAAEFIGPVSTSWLPPSSPH